MKHRAGDGPARAAKRGPRNDSSLRAEPAPSLSLSLRRARRISQDSREVDQWLAQMEMWELGHPSTRPKIDTQAAKQARELLHDKPPELKKQKLLRWIVFDQILTEHPLIEAEVRKYMVGGRKLPPPKVPDWWTRSRTPGEIEEFRDRCRLWREMQAMRAGSDLMPIPLGQPQLSRPSRLHLVPSGEVKRVLSASERLAARTRST